MSTTESLLEAATSYAAGFTKGGLPVPPGKRVAIVACMDARVNPYGIFGLSEGDAHVIRNAGGAVTDDAIRSLAISQRLLGTQEIVLVHHTDCGMLTFTDSEFARQVQEDTGIRPPWAPEAFSNIEEDVRQSIARVKTSPFLPRRDAVRGFVFDVKTGKLEEVVAEKAGVAS
jgi:carbonic anhydrase